MWDPIADLTMQARDIPCNTHIYPRIRMEMETVGGSHLYGMGGAHQEPEGYLDLTVCCRSNDIIWGAYGANAVHFSMLHEYMAGRIGVGVGTMYQLSNNWHAYVDVLDRVGDPNTTDPYLGIFSSLPMGEDWDAWDMDLQMFMEGASTEGQFHRTYTNKWFSLVAEPMIKVHRMWSSGERDLALQHVNMVGASDWREAARLWMLRRTDR